MCYDWLTWHKVPELWSSLLQIYLGSCLVWVGFWGGAKPREESFPFLLVPDNFLTTILTGNHTDNDSLCHLLLPIVYIFLKGCRSNTHWCLWWSLWKGGSYLHGFERCPLKSIKAASSSWEWPHFQELKYLLNFAWVLLHGLSVKVK